MTSLPGYIYSMIQKQNKQIVQVSTRVYKRKAHKAKCTKASGGPSKRCGESLSLDHTKQKIESFKHTFSIPRPRTYTSEDKQAWVLDSEGLASMDLGTHPRLGHMDKRITQLITWVNMMQMPVRMRKTWNILGSLSRKNNSRRRTSATRSKKAMVSQGSKTNTHITRCMSWTDIRSTRSMSTIMT